MVSFRNYVSWRLRITTPCVIASVQKYRKNKDVEVVLVRELSCCDPIQIVPSLFYLKFNARYICVMVWEAIPVRLLLYQIKCLVRIQQ